ncbi:MAG: hypothetical protein JO076_11030 [Verrucomicrobia bacterium]|nr:hypothetical protein [Verrucomicrobiota bacterium]
MGNTDRGALQQLQLRRSLHDNSITRNRTYPIWIDLIALFGISVRTDQKILKAALSDDAARREHLNPDFCGR